MFGGEEVGQSAKKDEQGEEEEEEEEEGELDSMCVVSEEREKKEEEEERRRGEGAEGADDSFLTAFRNEGWFGGGVCLFVAVLCALSFVEGISVNGLYNINISNLERRFELTSSQAGLISSSGEIGAIIFVLFVSFYGGRSHRPRVVGGGGFLLGLGCFFFLLPHLVVEPYTIGLGLEENEGCGSGGSVLNCSSSRTQGSASRLFPLFILGQALQGIGFTPAFTCGFAYIDDHATTENTALYMGTTYAITALGVGIGYVVGGNLLSLWVDIGRTDVSKVPITNNDKRWVGAWWIGYTACGVLFVVISCLICLFPRYMAGSKTLMQEREGGLSAAQALRHRSGTRKSIFELILSFPKALFSLICNPLYILLVLVGLGDSLIVSGIAGFAPKIIEEKFNVKPTESGLIMGAVTLMGGAGGMVMGGFLIKKLQLKLRGMIQMCLIYLVLGAFFGGGCFFIHCPNHRFAGISSVYGSAASHEVPEEGDLNAPCNANCSCTTYRYDPVCGQDGVTYFSSCHAGCPSHLFHTVQVEGKRVKMFNSCLCITDALLDGGRNGSGNAVGGQCAGACPQVWSFVVVLFLGIFFTFLNVTPISMGIMRCVPSAERSVGLGLQWVTLRLLGSIPGPILTGAVLDFSCQVWQRTCNGQGNCWVYDSQDMSLRLFLLWVVVKVTALLLLFVAHVYYNKKGHAVVEENERQTESMSVRTPSNNHTPNNRHAAGFLKKVLCLAGGSEDSLPLNVVAVSQVDGNGGVNSPKGGVLVKTGRNDRPPNPQRGRQLDGEQLIACSDRTVGGNGVVVQEPSTSVDLPTSGKEAAAPGVSGRPCAGGADLSSLSAVRVYPSDDPGWSGKKPKTNGPKATVVNTLV